MTTLLGVDVGAGDQPGVKSAQDAPRSKEEKMRCRKCAYWLSGLSFVFATILLMTIDWREGPIDPTSWESVIVDLGLAAPMVFIGLRVVVGPKDLLNWLGMHVHWHPPAFSFRVFGCCLFVGGIIGLALGVLNTLVALGVVSSSYSP